MRCCWQLVPSTALPAIAGACTNWPCGVAGCCVRRRGNHPRRHAGQCAQFPACAGLRSAARHAAGRLFCGGRPRSGACECCGQCWSGGGRRSGRRCCADGRCSACWTQASCAAGGGYLVSPPASLPLCSLCLLLHELGTQGHAWCAHRGSPAHLLVRHLQRGVVTSPLKPAGPGAAARRAAQLLQEGSAHASGVGVCAGRCGGRPTARSKARSAPAWWSWCRTCT